MLGRQSRRFDPQLLQTDSDRCYESGGFLVGKELSLHRFVGVDRPVDRGFGFVIEMDRAVPLIPDGDIVAARLEDWFAVR